MLYINVDVKLVSGVYYSWIHLFTTKQKALNFTNVLILDFFNVAAEFHEFSLFTMLGYRFVAGYGLLLLFSSSSSPSESFK